MIPFTKSRRAKNADDYETWIEGGVSPTLNAFDNATEVRATVVVAVDTYNQAVSEVSQTLRDPNGTFGDALPAVLCVETGIGWWKEDDVSGTLIQRDYKDARNVLVAPTLSASNDASRSPQSAEVTAQIEAVLKATSQEEGLDPVAFTASEQANSYAWERPVYPTLTAKAPNDTSNIQQGIRHGGAVRRLTPIECERLQGFPDNWTAGQADTHRYRQMGNAVTVNVAHYIGWLLADA